LFEIEKLIIVKTEELSVDELDMLSCQVRLDVLEVAGTSGGGHLGGTFSSVDILVNLFSSNLFDFKTKNKLGKDVDKFILSKGHACLAYYSILYRQNLITNDLMNTFAKNDGLGAQLDISVPFVDWNTGSLGHSIGICAGMAHASKLNRSKSKAVTLIGDSELAEGASWEAIAYAGDNQLSNLIVIIDRNRLSVTTRIENDSIYSGLDLKLESFGWKFIEINGHRHEELSKGLNLAVHSSKPVLMLANTLKGKGVSFMENNPIWHHTRPTEEQLGAAKNELKALQEELN
jgi:transketolase